MLYYKDVERNKKRNEMIKNGRINIISIIYITRCYKRDYLRFKIKI